eukprot:SAG31_NODE_249_length_19118_cov_47.456195_19_plen_154_part_00
MKALTFYLPVQAVARTNTYTTTMLMHRGLFRLQMMQQVAQSKVAASNATSHMKILGNRRSFLVLELMDLATFRMWSIATIQILRTAIDGVLARARGTSSGVLIGTTKSMIADKEAAQVHPLPAQLMLIIGLFLSAKLKAGFRLLATAIEVKWW